MSQKKSEKQTIEVYKGEKLTGNVNVSKLKKDSAAPSKDEVGGRGAWINVRCPWCESLRHDWVDYEGEGFTCGNCGGYYNVYV